jgi:hypothetical protein
MHAVTKCHVSKAGSACHSTAWHCHPGLMMEAKRHGAQNTGSGLPLMHNRASAACLPFHKKA